MGDCKLQGVKTHHFEMTFFLGSSTGNRPPSWGQKAKLIKQLRQDKPRRLRKKQNAHPCWKGLMFTTYTVRCISGILDEDMSFNECRGIMYLKDLAERCCRRRLFLFLLVCAVAPVVQRCFNL